MKVLVLGAGGAAGNGVTRCLRMAGHHTVGTNANPYDLELAETDERHLVPRADQAGYERAILDLCGRVRPGLVVAQPDAEVAALNELRDRLPVFLPSRRAIKICQNKWFSYCSWRGKIPQPLTFWLVFTGDVDAAFDRLGEAWLRPIHGAGGNGSLRTRDRVLAQHWVSHHDGWTRYTAAEVLSSRSVTWQSVWCDGELVAAQGRRRLSWANARSSPTGITGSTGVGETVSSPMLDDVAIRAVLAVDPRPHGVWGVDCAYTKDGRGIVPTEINIGRFFTTIEFFAHLGLNLPDLVCRLHSGERPEPVVNPLPPGRRWVRGMDRTPVLI